MFFYYFERFLREEVFSMLLRKKLIGLPQVQKILGWRHTGFNVHSKVRAQTTSEAERVGKYMIRLPCRSASNEKPFALTWPFTNLSLGPPAGESQLKELRRWHMML